MIIIRSIIYFVFLILATVIYSLLLISVGRILPYESRCRIANSWGNANMSLLKIICGLNYKLVGKENLNIGNCIVMSKHQSSWETMSIRGILPPKQVWVLKKELMSVPIFGWALKLCNPIAIDRKSGRKAVKQVISEGLKALNDDKWIVIFPEGTRVAPGQRRKYGIGGALLAEKSEFPVIPIAHNAGNFWRRRDIRKYPGTIQIIIGEPIQTKGKKASEIIKEVEAWIENRMEIINYTNQS